MAKFAAIIFAMPLAVVWHGYVLTRLWHWFVEPFGVPSINIAWASGIALLVSFLTVEAREDAKNSVTYTIVVWALRPLLVLGTGAAIAWFMS